MSLAKKIAHNTLIQIIGKVISTVLGLLSLALITRYLGQAGFGEYTTIITFLTIFAVIADFGLTLVTVQMIGGVKEKDRENKILNNLFGFRLVSIVFLLILAPLVLIFMPYSAAIKIGVLITTIYFIFPALSQIIIGLLQKKLSMDRAALAEVLSRIVLILAIFIVWFYDLGLNGILIATIASGASSFIFHYLFAVKFIALKPEWDLTLWKEIFSRSWPLAITIILNLIYLRTDIIFLSLFKSAGEVGLYGAAYKVVDVLTTLPFMFAGLILPILTAAWIDKKPEYFKNVLQKSFDFMAIIAIPLIIGGQFLAGPVMKVVAGSEFDKSGIILQFLIIAVAAIFLGTMFSHAVIALNKQKKLIGFYAFTSISSLIAYFILIPKFSYFGAAAVTIYSETLIAFFSAYCVFKYSRFFPNLRTIMKAIIASLGMGIFLYFYPDNLQLSAFSIILTIIIAVIIYFILLCLIGGVKLEDLKAISRKSSGSQPYNSSNL
ncbi:MAG: flippase [Patescibacteria group bacterium]|jgi:O-antigen/teichoic acid export membrane protein